MIMTYDIVTEFTTPQ